MTFCDSKITWVNNGIFNSNSSLISSRNGKCVQDFYVLLTAHLGILLVNNELDAQFFFFLMYMFISILYMFRAATCSSSGESIVSIRHLVYVTLYRWPSSMQAWMFHPNLHTRQSPTKSDIYQITHWYSWFSWWWAHGCSKHVENWNEHIQKKKLCIKLVIYKDYTRTHGQQNINKQTNYVALVRERTIPTERPPPVGEVNANFCG